jgi:hypothetical protein
MVVVLPAPFGPTNAQIAPRGNSKLRPASAGRDP